MAVTHSSDSMLLLEVAEYPLVVLNYHSEECGQPCQDFIPLFSAISEEERYSGILFLCIDTEHNPVAKAHILKHAKPIVTVYRNGLMTETVQTSSREEVVALLDKLLVV
jgi:hypothetical protein